MDNQQSNARRFAQSLGYPTLVEQAQKWSLQVALMAANGGRLSGSYMKFLEEAAEGKQHSRETRDAIVSSARYEMRALVALNRELYDRQIALLTWDVSSALTRAQDEVLATISSYEVLLGYIQLSRLEPVRSGADVMAHIRAIDHHATNADRSPALRAFLADNASSPEARREIRRSGIMNLLEACIYGS